MQGQRMTHWSQDARPCPFVEPLPSHGDMQQAARGRWRDMTKSALRTTVLRASCSACELRSLVICFYNVCVLADWWRGCATALMARCPAVSVEPQAKRAYCSYITPSNRLRPARPIRPREWHGSFAHSSQNLGPEISPHQTIFSTFSQDCTLSSSCGSDDASRDTRRTPIIHPTRLAGTQLPTRSYVTLPRPTRHTRRGLFCVSASKMPW